LGEKRKKSIHLTQATGRGESYAGDMWKWDREKFGATKGLAQRPKKMSSRSDPAIPPPDPAKAKTVERPGKGDVKTRSGG